MKRERKTSSKRAREFIRDELRLAAEDTPRVQATEEAIVAGLAKTRRAGIKLPRPRRGRVATRRRALGAPGKARGTRGRKAARTTLTSQARANRVRKPARARKNLR